MSIGTVYLVGAGPGDPGLLTLRAKALLERADYVLHDQLLSPEILRLIPAGIEIEPVDALPGKHPERSDSLHRRMIAQARAGKTVVRLKSGDPGIFGRMGEETAALREAGIPYEIVPGVTAALAAGANLEIPLTHRMHSSLLTIVAGHECAAKGDSAVDWANLAANRGTLAFYMGMARLQIIAENLIANGKSPSTPAVVVHRASWAGQRSITGTLADIADRALAANLEAPAVLLVGPVVGLKPVSSWFEKKPLLGRRILVTRTDHQAGELIELLRAQGAETIHHPLMEIAAPNDLTPLDTLIQSLNDEARNSSPWLVFTSVNGVERFVFRMKELWYDFRTFGRTKIAVIGSRTERALMQRGIYPNLVADKEANSEELAAELKKRAVGREIFLCMAEEGRDYLFEELSPIAHVKRIYVYRQQPIPTPLPMGSAFDIVTLTSPRLSELFLANASEASLAGIEQGKIDLAVNSRRLAAILTGKGFPVKYCADQPDMRSLVAAIVGASDRESAT